MTRDRALEIAEVALHLRRRSQPVGAHRSETEEALRVLSEIRADLPELEQVREERDRLKRRIAGAAPDNTADN